MSLTGTLQTMSLADLLQWIGQGRKTGVLLIHGPRYTKKLMVRDGLVVASASEDPTDHLGHFLLRQNRITEDHLRKALESQQRTGTMLGRLLVDVGLISEEDLYQLLMQKAEETIFGLFLWPDARFEFREGDVPAKVAVPLSLRIEDVLLKGLTWFDEHQRIRKLLPSGRLLLRHTAVPLPPEAPGPASLGHRLYALIDGARTIEDLCLESHASEFVVFKILFALVRRGFVEIAGEASRTPGAAPRAEVQELVQEARAHLAGGRSEEALKVIDEARAVAPLEIDLRVLTEEAQAAYVQDVTASGLDPTLVPSLVRPLESLLGEALSPQEVFILSRVNGEWDIASIVSLCPFQESEAYRTMKDLEVRGLLAVRRAG